MKFTGGFFITAAFIGPGTITIATLAGAQNGLHLCAVLAFAVFATIVLQDTVFRLALHTRQGLSQTLLNSASAPWLKVLIGFLIISGIGLGNAAYQAGNLTGAALGIAPLLNTSISPWTTSLGILAAALLLTGSFKWVERILIGLVSIMSLVFVVTLIYAQPDISDLVSQAVQPFAANTSLTTVLALIGTTIVPYNLFLQAELAQKVPAATESVNGHLYRSERLNNASSIALGGIITLAIMATASLTFFTTKDSVTLSTISTQLSPLLGEHAAWFFAIGIFAAGLTSAITAPLAGAYALCGVFGWTTSMQSKGFRAICLIIISAGVFFAATGGSPLTLITLAQVSNAVLLPVIVGMLVWVMRRYSQVFGQQIWLSVAAVLIWLGLCGLSISKLTALF